MLEGIDEIVSDGVEAVRSAYTALENGVCQDDHEDGWNEALVAASELSEQADALADQIREQLRRF